MNVLVDTSVWVDHFRKSNGALANLIEVDLVLTHPMVIAELACGTPPSPRRRTLNDLKLFRSTNQASLNEVLEFIEQKELYGLGCGLVDLTLLASTLITPAVKLWTLDKRLEILAERFSVGYRPN